MFHQIIRANFKKVFTSIECRIKIKIKVITLANHKGHRQPNLPIKTRSTGTFLTESAGKRVQVSHVWF